MKQLLLSMIGGAVLMGSGLAQEEIVSALWKEYIQSPDTHPNLPNCSYAGYQYGEKPIPDIQGPVYNVTTFGAKGDGETDDTAAIRAALDAVGEEGGVVYLPNGRYAVSGVLFVHTNRTVIRGESRDGTEIVFTQPLDRAYGTFFYDTSRGERASRWTYSGGLIWFGPKSRGNTYRRDAAPDSPIRQGEFREAWLEKEGEKAVISTPAKRGDRQIVLDRPFPVRPGDFVLLRQSDPGNFSMVKHLSGGGEWAEAFDWEEGPRGAAWPQPSPMRWVVEIAAVEDNTLTLRQPLRFDVRPEWSPTVNQLGELLQESGIETITLRFNRGYSWTYEKHHHREEGWNAPYFNNAVHCWLRDVTMIDMDSGPNLSCAKNVTLSNSTLKASGPETMEHHHGTICRSSSLDSLFSDFRIESKPWHGMNVESYSSGNVWTRGVMKHGTFDSHRRIPYEGIRSDVTLVANDGTHGGTGGPLMGARFVNWNVRTLGGPNYIVGWGNATPSGAIVGLQGSNVIWDAQAEQTPTGKISGCRVESQEQVPNPPNLYEAQLQLRLGQEEKIVGP